MESAGSLRMQAGACNSESLRSEQGTACPHHSTDMTIKRAASRIKVTHPLIDSGCLTWENVT